LTVFPGFPGLSTWFLQQFGKALVMHCVLTPAITIPFQGFVVKVTRK
jgi:hypothetical protein